MKMLVLDVNIVRIYVYTFSYLIVVILTYGILQGVLMEIFVLLVDQIVGKEELRYA